MQIAEETGKYGKMLVKVFKNKSFKQLLKPALFLTVVSNTGSWSCEAKKKNLFFSRTRKHKENTVILGIINTLSHASLFLEKDCFIQCRKYKQNSKQNSLR